MYPHRGQVLQHIIYHRLKSRTELQTHKYLLSHTDVIRSAKGKLILKKKKKLLYGVTVVQEVEQVIH